MMGWVRCVSRPPPRLGDIGPAAQAAVPKLQQAIREDRVVEPAARKALEKLGVKEKR